MTGTLVLDKDALAVLTHVPKVFELGRVTYVVREMTRQIALHWDELPLEVRAELRSVPSRSTSKRHSLKMWFRAGLLMIRAPREDWVEFLRVVARFWTTLEDAIEREAQSAERAFQRFAKDPAMHAAHDEAVTEIQAGQGYTSAQAAAICNRD
ncbi:MAG: hypothetical protein Tsb0020_46700 [Haliangiales bacterium]